MTDQMRQALAERHQLIEVRAHALTQAAMEERAPWTRRLGAPPREPDRREAWLRHLHTLAAYRDRYHITTDNPLGPPPASTAQQADATRARAALNRARRLIAAHRTHEPDVSVERPLYRPNEPTLSF